MAKYKNIIWRHDMKPNEQGELFANVHLLVGYNQASITDLQKMADELRRTFPQATYDEICCSRVTKSTYCDRFTMVVWNAYIPKADYPGWTQMNNDRVDYHWAT